MKSILVYGWYNKKNIGDDLFVSSFEKLFPTYKFKFTYQLTKSLLNDADAVILGGGSFLSKDIAAPPDVIATLKTKKIMYIGVGAETDISPMHLELMSLAKLVAIRSPEQLDKVRALNVNTIAIPDIVYSLQNEVALSPKKNKSVLILPNIEVVPNHEAAHWKYSSFEYFKSEFSQFLDEIISNGYSINFFSMCHNATMSDEWASAQIIGMMKRRSINYQLPYVAGDMKEITAVMSQYSHIITQRYHGIVLAEMMGTPYTNIHHHDKLKYASPMNGNRHSYYGLLKQDLLHSFYNSSSGLPLKRDIFDTLKQRVINILS